MSMCSTHFKIRGIVTKFLGVTTAYYVGDIIGVKLAIFRENSYLRSNNISDEISLIQGDRGFQKLGSLNP